MKKLMICALVLLLALTATAPAAAIRSRGVRGTPYTTTDGYFGIRFNHEIDVPNFGEVIIETDYSSTINLSDWKITDNKNLLIEMSVISKPDNLSLWVEHMHADTFVESTLETWDGVKQDYMDDSYHSDMSYGFFIDPNYDYSETFSIEGFSQMIQNHYSYYYYHSSSTHRLTELELTRDFNVYGSSFFIVYDIVFRDDSWSGERTPKIVIEDNIILDLDEGWQDNTGDIADKPEGISEWDQFWLWLESPAWFGIPVVIWAIVIIIVVIVIIGAALYIFL